MSEREGAGKEPAIACNLQALNAEQRERRHSLATILFAAAKEIQDFPDGYALRFSAANLLAVAEFVSLERLCCPFLKFALEVAGEGGPLWLRLGGPPGAKEFLRTELQGHLQTPGGGK